MYDPGLSDMQVFSITFTSFVLLARTHRISVNVVLFYRVHRVSAIFRVSHMAYRISRVTKGNYSKPSF